METQPSSLSDEPTSDLPTVVLADGTSTLLVTSHEDVRSFFLDPSLSRALASEAAGASGPLLAMSMTELDPPLHTRVRELVAASWSVRSVNRIRAELEQAAHALVDGIGATRPPADLVEAFCAPFSFAGQFEMLGVPAERREPIRALLASRTVSVLGGLPRERIHADEQRLYDEMLLVLDAKRARPGSAVLDTLVLAADRDGLIDERELRGIAASFLLDGPFLAATQIANALACLLTHPRDMELLRGDPDMLRPAVEELLRFEPSVNHSLSRVATVDLALGKQTVIAGKTVTALLPLANRDESAFSTPAELDLRRGVNPHLTFGRGAHTCLGAHLMRLEMRISLETMLGRLPGLRLAVPPEELRFFATQGARGVLELPVSW